VGLAVVDADGIEAVALTLETCFSRLRSAEKIIPSTLTC